MKKLFIPVGLFSLFAVLIAGGCLNGGGNGDVWAAFVRVAGEAWLDSASEIRKPVIWEDGGDAQLLETTSGKGGVEDLFVADGDVYAAGSAIFDDDLYMHAAYWKNGKITKLPGVEGGLTDAVASAIEFHNGNLYVAGTVGTVNSVGQPGLWIDDELTVLPVINALHGGSANAMYIDGNTIYTGGFVDDDSEQALPAYWRNGELTYYECPGDQCIGKGIAVDNGDIYLLVGVNNDDHTYKVVYYKNGELVELTPLDDDSQTAYPMDIAVVLGKVLVVGYYYPGDGTYKPVVWVDGQMKQLSMLDDDLLGVCNAIQVYRGHLFIAGYTTSMKDPNVTPKVVSSIPCYWVDGERVDLPGLTVDNEIGTEGEPLAIFVSVE